MDLGKTVKILRQLRKMSQASLADAINVERPYLSSIEQGHNQPSLTLVKEIASQLRIPPALLLIGDGDPADPIQKELQKVWGLLLSIKSSEAEAGNHAKNHDNGTSGT